ncbi:MAG: Sb-PDE family phosphodiesterase [Bacteroidota bacterium]
MTLKKIILLLIISFTFTNGQTNHRSTINIPDILGYKTLKCDFHMHTVFSDGYVWPTVRVEEAWHNGLDAIAITDHIEYQPKKNDIPTNHNRSYEVAKKSGEYLGITIIKGAEITRGMPPGHINALFLKDTNPLVKDDWKEVVVEASKQGAFLFWNHPGWTPQLKDGKTVWYDEHIQMIKDKILNGAEIVNGYDYYPEIQDWCLQNNLAMLGNSDIHSPITFDYPDGERRTVTLVFAKDNSEESIKDALMNQRTAVFIKNVIYGKEGFLKEIFNKSISFNKNEVELKGKSWYSLQVTNNSDLSYELQLVNGDDQIQFPESVKLLAGKTVLFPVYAKEDNITLTKTFDVAYKVKNLKISSEEVLNTTFKLSINAVPK